MSAVQAKVLLVIKSLADDGLSPTQKTVATICECHGYLETSVSDGLSRMMEPGGGVGVIPDFISDWSTGLLQALNASPARTRNNRWRNFAGLSIV